MLKSIFVVVASLLLVALPSQASETKTIAPTSLSPPTEEIRLYPNKGVSITYFRSGQVIETVWLDNKSRVLLSTDGCLSGLNLRCAKSSATVLHLSRLNSSFFLERSNHSTLTVVTIDSQGVRYTYRYALEVVDRTTDDNALTLLEYVTPSPLPIRPSKRIATIVPSVLGKRLRFAADRASRKGLLFDTTLIARTDRFIQLIEQGYPPVDAAQQAGISSEYVNALYKLTTP